MSPSTSPTHTVSPTLTVAPTLAPTLTVSPTHTIAPTRPIHVHSSCYPTFKAETTYTAGTTVSSSIVEHTTEPCTPDLTYQAAHKTSLCNADGTRPVAITRTYNYRCVDGSMSLYCQQGWAFGPASLYGHVAWEKLDECYVSPRDSRARLTTRKRFDRS